MKVNGHSKTKVAAMGTFDMVHPGHISYLKQAKQMGDYLIVIIARDKSVLREKGRLPIVNENDRLEMIKHINLVDEVVLGDENDRLKPIVDVKADIVCLGYDHKVNEKELEDELKKKGLNVKIRRAKEYNAEKYKSTLLKKNGIAD